MNETKQYIEDQVPYYYPNPSIGFISFDQGENAPTKAPLEKYSSGATRNPKENELDYEGFLSPLVLKAYAQYMHKNRFLADGSTRNSDNWQKGIPLESYMKSLLRHLEDVWLIHRGFPEEARSGLEEALNGLIFNSMGYLHEVIIDIKSQQNKMFDDKSIN